MDVLKVEHLSKNYGDKEALKDVSFRVAPHQIFALIGPNGAGKTTFLKCLLDLVSYKQGNIIVNGSSHLHKKTRYKLAYVPDNFHFYPYYTVKSVLLFYAKIYGIKDKNWCEKRIAQAVDIFHMGDTMNQKMRHLSKGQRQRVGLSTILLSQANLILLDEPFSGLDPIMMKEFRDLLRDLAHQEGKTVFINSHILSELSLMCDSVAVIDKGRCLSSGKLTDLLSDHQSLEEYFYHSLKGEKEVSRGR